jgi:hypothetical protein
MLPAGRETFSLGIRRGAIAPLCLRVVNNFMMPSAPSPCFGNRMGELEGFAAQGGGINFAQKRDNIRFVVNLKAIERAGLTISSKMSAIATVVQDEEVEP